MNRIFFSGCLILLFSCQTQKISFDAMGHFEADETTIMSESSGRLLDVYPLEGEKIQTGDTVAIADTSGIVLQLEQIGAQMNALTGKIPGIKAQEKVVDTELAIQLKERERFSKLVDEQAVSGKSLDDINHQIELAKARKLTFAAQLSGLQQDLKVLEAQRAVMMEQKAHCIIVAPVSGTVLDLVARKGEVVVPGKPVIKLADLENITLKAYVTGDQFSSIKLGQTVKVRIDAPDDLYFEYPGLIYHIADKAEFTPKVIQTRKERANLVYPVKVRVKNDGRIKIGMPGELLFQ